MDGYFRGDRDKRDIAFVRIRGTLPFTGGSKKGADVEKEEIRA